MGKLGQLFIDVFAVGAVATSRIREWPCPRQMEQMDRLQEDVVARKID